MAEITVHYEGPIVTRADAKANGFDRYFTGKPCPKGHVEQRYTATTKCIECIRLYNLLPQNRALRKQWKQSEDGKASERDYNFRHPEQRMAIQQRSNIKRKDAKRIYNHSPAGLAAKERYLNSEKGKISVKRVRGNRRRRIEAGGIFTEHDFQKLLIHQKKCYICGRRFNKDDPAEMDHVIALSDDGTNNPSNVALAHRSCNRKKHAKRMFLM